MQKSKEIYLDYAAATPIDSAVLSVMQKILKENFANSSSIHDMGTKNKKILEKNRVEVAKILGAHSNEIVFTSGATESNNLAIVGTIKIFAECFLPHIITTNIEHSSVFETCKYLEKTKQAEVTYVPVEKNGIVDPRKIKRAIKSNTVLVSVMYANNEIGTIQPIQEIAKEIRHYRNKGNLNVLETWESDGASTRNFSAEKYPCPKTFKFPLFHTDATQAINYLPIKVEKLGVDLMSFNGGKIYGPKGIGCLFIKRKTLINKIIYGGDQEFGLRAGTENLSAVVGLTEALKITEKIKEKESARLLKFRYYFFEKLLNLNLEIKINGDLKNRLPNNINISIPKIPSDLLVLEFSARGIYVSEKSACKSGDKKGSYVIKAINPEQNGSLRFSLGRQTTKADVDYVIESLSEILFKLKKWYN